ncbi:hypothetical protein ACK1FP_004695, partial [Salmonella enterica]
AEAQPGAFADITEPPAKLLLVFGFQDPVEVQCQLLCYFQLRLFFTHQPDGYRSALLTLD